MPDKMLVFIGGVLVALVTGFFSFLNLVVSKEQKVSEFREKWINALREEIAAYIAAVSHLASCYTNFKKIHVPNGGASPQQRLDFFAEHADAYEAVRDNYNRITLRINPDDTNVELRVINTAFLEALEETRKLYNAKKYSEAKKYCTTLRDRAIPLLKLEWNRVRDGEPAYQKARKWARLLLMVGAAGSLLALATVFYAATQPASSASSKGLRIILDQSTRPTVANGGAR